MQDRTDSDSRKLLRRLKEILAAAGGGQDRLDQITHHIADSMGTEVCSIYLLRAGEVLELFATQGLNPSAVHSTRLRVGEGLVGDIAAHARSLALDDAQAHPQFAYRPEPGEEIYHSLAGVPIVRAGRVLGVLVVQNRTRRQYDEEEIETLQTIAMVLAELIAADPDAELIIDIEALQVICANNIFTITMKTSAREALLSANYDPLDTLMRTLDKVDQTAQRLGYA